MKVFSDLLNKLNKLNEAYLHCHECGWSQDDFWTKTYNPLRYLQEWEKDLLSNKLDEQFTDDAEFLRENGNITLREVIARECEKAAENIRNMKFMKEPDLGTARCPNCGFSLDID